MKKLNIALVYDWLDSWGGAERVLVSLKKIFPQAPIYTSIYNKKHAPWAKTLNIKTSFLQKFPLAQNYRRLYTPLLPLAFESFNFNQYDVVISVSSFAAKGIITKPETKHFCYLLTPTRFLWLENNYSPHHHLKQLAKPIINHLKSWDQAAIWRPDKIIAISKTVKLRCQKYYHRHTDQIIYPPVDTQKFHFGKEEKNFRPFFLLVSRLEPYKKIDLAIKTFNKLKWPLKIVGQGTQLKKLKKIAHRNIQFLGHLTDRQLLSYYQKCQAVIFPQEEDFGIVSLEAQACGKPVIAFGRGGAKETIAHGKTGEFFYPQNKEALEKTLLKFIGHHYDKNNCRKNAQKFAEKVFLQSWQKLIRQYV